MDITDLKNLDPDLIEEYIIELPDISYDIFEIELNAERKLADHRLKMAAAEGILVKKMTENPKEYGLKKVTNNDITYALNRDPKMAQMKQKEIDLDMEVKAAINLRRTFYVKRDAVFEMNKRTLGMFGLETRGNTISDRKRTR